MLLRDRSIEFLPYQLWMVGYGPTMALTGNGELGFDSGEVTYTKNFFSKENVSIQYAPFQDVDSGTRFLRQFQVHQKL